MLTTVSRSYKDCCHFSKWLVGTGTPETFTERTPNGQACCHHLPWRGCWLLRDCLLHSFPECGTQGNLSGAQTCFMGVVMHVNVCWENMAGTSNPLFTDKGQQSKHTFKKRCVKTGAPRECGRWVAKAQVESAIVETRRLRVEEGGWEVGWVWLQSRFNSLPPAQRPYSHTVLSGVGTIPLGSLEANTQSSDTEKFSVKSHSCYS